MDDYGVFPAAAAVTMHQGTPSTSASAALTDTAEAMLCCISPATCVTYAYQDVIPRARVVDVCDGDTLRVSALFGAGLAGPYLLRVRLRDIDADELRSPNPVAAARARRARDRLTELVLGEEAGSAAPGTTPWSAAAAAATRATLEARPVFVDLRRVGLDKYGRVLADAWIARADRSGADAAGPALSLGDVLIREGLVRTMGAGVRGGSQAVPRRDAPQR